MKPALLLCHAQAQRRAQIATAEAAVTLYEARVQDELPGTPEWNAALAKLGTAQAALAELRGEQPTVVTP